MDASLKDGGPVVVPLVGTEINPRLPRPSKQSMIKTIAMMPHIAAARMPAPEPEVLDTLDPAPGWSPVPEPAGPRR